MLDTFARMPPEEKQIWWQVAAGLLALMLGLLWLESRYFKPSARVGSWLSVRLMSILAALPTVAIVIVPARAVGGPAALGLFILSLYTLAPLVWFGSHVLVGRRVRPVLTVLESLALGVTGLAILAIPGTAYFAMEGPLNAASREIGQRREVPADNPPLEHQVQPVQRYNLAGAGLIYTQSLIGAPDMRLVRVELRQGGQWPKDQSTAHPVYCTHGNDVHLMWSAKEPPPYLRLHWAQSNGSVIRSEFTPQIAFEAAPPAAEFSMGFRPDGVDPIAPIPRARAYLVLTKEGLAPYTQILGNPPGAGEVRTTDCVMTGFKRVTSTEDWQVQAIGLLFYLPTGSAALRSLIERP
ncbi:hypothetical protein [Polaromonas sp.]|uniref:hypothetical protein n=1 Tax=Polaromonas sp. TaxID=1869339 RepID=UPI002730F87D|nr:hypothetical protein [Polaromonas sp.]MDP1742466.1 hypothetical protein [Polaromonas sp.]